MRILFILSLLFILISSCKKGLRRNDDDPYVLRNSMTYSYNGSAFNVTANCSDSLFCDTSGHNIYTGARPYYLRATDGITFIEIKINAGLVIGNYNFPVQGYVQIYKYNTGCVIGYPGSFQLQISSIDGKNVTGSFSGNLRSYFDGGSYPINGYFSNVSIVDNIVVN